MAKIIVPLFMWNEASDSDWCGLSLKTLKMTYNDVDYVVHRFSKQIWKLIVNNICANV